MMCYTAHYNPSQFLQNGVKMTVYTALWGRRYWKSITQDPEPYYQEKIFTGSQGVPIFGLVASLKMLIARLSVLMALLES